MIVFEKQLLEAFHNSECDLFKIRTNVFGPPASVTMHVHRIHIHMHVWIERCCTCAHQET